MFKAKDIMETKVICIRPEMPIYEAIRLLPRSNLSDLPVVDKNLRPLGILSEKDVFQLLYDMDVKTNFKVKDYMNPFIKTFDVKDSLIELCDCLRSFSFRRIPITQDGMLVGMITPNNIIETILKMKSQDNKKKKAV